MDIEKLKKEYLKKKKAIIKRYSLRILDCEDLDHGIDLAEKINKKLADLFVEYKEKIKILKNEG